jgi:glycine betaine/choline ABC-type transport system substrate-binding protein
VECVTRAAAVLTAAGVLATGAFGLASACAPAPDRVVVGSKNFSEQDILGEIIALWIERTTDLEVERRLHLGGTFIAHRALTSGEIDLYPEYTGTAYTAILERPPGPDPDSVLAETRAAYGERWSLEWLDPLGFENTFAMLVRASTADSLGLAAFSDVGPVAPRLRAGFGYEFMQREDGFPGLAAAYGLSFADPPREMDLGLIYRAVASGEIDLTAGNSTDGRIDALDLRVLPDDLGYFPPYEAAIVVRRETLERQPSLAAALRQLSGRIATSDMARLNRAVDLEGRGIRDVAREWVDARLAEAAGAPPP